MSMEVDDGIIREGRSTEIKIPCHIRLMFRFIIFRNDVIYCD
jgi:hypothetical protein